MFTLTRQRGIEFSFIVIAISLFIKLLCIGSNDLLAEEAYYWNYSVHLDIGYLDHPPMVAVLIKLFTTLFGNNEFGVRIASIVCWLATALFSFKLTHLIRPGAGKYAVMLLAILPFFFLHSLVITPDLPLIVCWAASLYYLYRAQVLDNKISWYAAGIWLGLGVLSKYSILLLGPAALLYLIWLPHARKMFLKKEPYACVLLMILFFTPVIYWNATHDWASFVFQSTRRLEETSSFSFHHLLGLLIVFLTPLGLLGFITLFRHNKPESYWLDIKTKRFLQIYTLVPLAVFSLFSLRHEIKFNWIGPCMLAVIPWLAILIDKTKSSLRTGWLITSIILLLGYSFMILCIIFGRPERINQQLFSKYIAWSDLTRQVHAIAVDVESNMHTTPFIVPMDVYNIASELAFYQAKLLEHGEIHKIYTPIGGDLFGRNSLMYRYWSQGKVAAGNVLILIDENPVKFEEPQVSARVIAKSETKALWSHSQGVGMKIRPYYYKVVQLKEVGG